jgi:CRP-like cAMP-binding protein
MADTDTDFDLLIKAGCPVRSFKAGGRYLPRGRSRGRALRREKRTVEIRIRDRFIGTLGERSIFGEMALVDGQPRCATASAATDTELVPLAEKGFSLLVAYQPNFALSMLRVLVKHVRTTTTVIR